MSITAMGAKRPTDSIAVMKQALEALEESGLRWPNIVEAITSLRQAIAEAEKQEPELKMGIDYTLAQTNTGIGERAIEAYEAAKQRGWSGVSDERLMKMPDEPVIDKSAAIRIATALGWKPKREWVGLTDEEIEALASWWPSYDQMPALKVLIKDVTNSLKEKNQ